MTSRWAALGVVFLTRLSMGLQFQSIASVAPFIRDEFELSHAQLGWLIGLYLLPGAALALPAGLLGRRFGDRSMVVAGLALMAAGGLVTAFSQSLAIACVGRTVSGAGAVLLNVLLAKMVADWFVGRELATAMAIMLTAWPAGIGLGVALLGVLASLASWRAAVEVTVGAAAVSAVLMLGLYADPPGARTNPARPVAGGGWLPGRPLALALFAGAAWAAFNAGLIIFVSFAPGVLMSHGLSVGRAGLLVSLAIWVSLGSVPLGGWLADRVRGQDGLIVVGCLGCALAMATVTALAVPAIGLTAIGLLVGLPSGAMTALLPRSVNPAHLAAGLGVYYTVFYLGMALAQPAAGFVRDLSARPVGPVLFAAALMAAPVLALAGFRAVQRTAPASPSG